MKTKNLKKLYKLTEEMEDVLELDFVGKQAIAIRLDELQDAVIEKLKTSFWDDYKREKKE